MKALVCLAILLLSYGAPAQTPDAHGLSVTGSVLSVTPTFPFHRRDDSPFIVYSANLRLQIRNDGDVPLILFHPLGCEIKVEFLSSAAFGSEATVALSVDSWEDPDRARDEDYIRYIETPLRLEYARKLETSSDPEKAGLLVLRPGQPVEVAVSVMLNAGYSLEIRPGQLKKDLLRNSPKSEFDGLRIIFHRSFQKVRPDASFLKILQAKWKPIGYLPVDSNGEFSIKSETIINKTN